MGDWLHHGDEASSMPLRMEKSCVIRDSGTGHEFPPNFGCEPWTVTETSLKAYAAYVNDVLVDFVLTYPVYFQKEGSVEFKYRKESIGKGDFMTFGAFKFEIDGVPAMIDRDSEKDDW